MVCCRWWLFSYWWLSLYKWLWCISELLSLYDIRWLPWEGTRLLSLYFFAWHPLLFFDIWWLLWAGTRLLSWYFFAWHPLLLFDIWLSSPLADYSFRAEESCFLLSFFGFLLPTSLSKFSISLFLKFTYTFVW